MKSTVRIMLYLPPDLAEWLTQNAKEMGMARNQLIVQLLIISRDNFARLAGPWALKAEKKEAMRRSRDPNATG